MSETDPPWETNPVKDEVIENVLLTTLHVWMYSGGNDTLIKLVNENFTDAQVSEAKILLFRKCAAVEPFINKGDKKDKNWHSGSRTGMVEMIKIRRKSSRYKTFSLQWTL